MTALLEVEALFNTADGQLKGAPRDLDLVLSLRCELTSVLDLTDESFLIPKLLKVRAESPYSGLKSGQKWQFLNLIQSTLTDLHRENVFGYPALLSYTE